MKSTKKYSHKNCRKHASVLKDTVFYRSNLSLMAWFYSLLIFSNSVTGVRESFLRKQLGLGINSTHRLNNKVRLHIASQAREKRLGGPGKRVHIDEAHLRRLTGGTANRLQNAIVMGMECEGIVLTGIIPNQTRKTFLTNIERRVRRGSEIVTDCHSSYRCLASHGWDHIQINHSKGFCNRDKVTNNPIETYWSSLKRTFKAYRQTSPENLWLFLAEFEFRYNRRHRKTPNFEELTHYFPELTPEFVIALRADFEWG